jgi:hypothetical protein
VHTGRRRGKSRSRILYWFRTPPGVRVGRSALDEDAIRLLEEYNPDVEFDWTRILKAPPESAPEPPARPRASGRGEERRREDRQQPPASRPAEPDPITEIEAAAIEAIEPESSEAGADVVGADAPSPALARLGPEGLIRLRARYAELMTRIGQRISDQVRQDELKSRAERLNPDNWVTDQEVSQGLDAYEATFEEIRAVIGRPRKRRRRRRGSRGDTAAVNGGTLPQEQTAEAEPVEDEDAETRD